MKTPLSVLLSDGDALGLLSVLGLSLNDDLDPFRGRLASPVLADEANSLRSIPRSVSFDLF